MKAVRKTRPEVGADLVDIPVPKIKPGHVLVKVQATSICGTDVHIWDWNKWAQGRIKYPQTMGHELAGEVVEIADDVKSIDVGDYISSETHIPCGHCYQCKTGKMHICQNMTILGVDTDGAFAEYILVPEVVAWKNDRSIEPGVAAIQEPMGNAVDTVFIDEIAGKSALLVGIGPIGMIAAGLCRIGGATTIIATDLIEYRLDMAKKMGADYAINPKNDNLYDRVMEITGGNGVDVVLEMSGSAKALNDALKCLTPGGRVSLLGLFNDDITLDINNGMVFKAAKVYGITGRRMFETWYMTRNFLASKRIDVKPVITHTLPLEEYARGMELMKSGESGKIVLIP
ncbi:MAG: L-threonine 3-dehydrogenase [Candidatus Zixiibacteriota bacterium]